MAKHRIRRWFQFGVLDLLILTAIVAVAALLYRPVQSEAYNAPPWVIGEWTWRQDGDDEFRRVTFFPDGCFHYAIRTGEEVVGFRWTIVRVPDAQAFALTFGNERWLIRGEWGSGLLDIRNVDGSLKTELEHLTRLEGPWRDGLPHGTWKMIHAGLPDEAALVSLEYVDGEPVGIQAGSDTVYFLPLLKQMREARRLPDLPNAEGTK
jgi:hypothetical protein